MPRHTVFLVALLFIVCIAGCNNDKPPTLVRTPEIPDPVPFHRQGTVGEYAVLSGAMNVRVSGYGLVTRLGTRGDSGVPPQIEKYLIHELSRRGIGFHSTGTEKLPPEKIVRSRDTAVVWVWGSVPALAPIGTRFDLYVDALPQSDTATLDGGHLMDTKLYLSLDDLALPMGGTRSVAISVPARGDTFVDPFLEPDRSEDMFKFRQARIPNGGVVTTSMDIRLELRQSDWNRSMQIADAINARFKDSYSVARGRDSRFPDQRRAAFGQPAVARNNHVVELYIPASYRDDYIHFLELVLHLPLTRGSGVWEARARELIQHMETPGGNCLNSSLVLEAMGRIILPVLKPAYGSKSEEASYFCAVTGMRLGDVTALPVIILHALKSDSPFRMMAMRELSRYSRDPDARITLENLLDDEKDDIRILAYECLVRMGWSPRIQAIPITDTHGRVQFYVDVVQTKGKYIIYATRTGQPRMALFGQGIPVEKNIFFRMPDGLLVIDGKSEPDPTLPTLSANHPGGRIRSVTGPPMPAKKTGDETSDDLDGNAESDVVAKPVAGAQPPAMTLKGPVLVMDRMIYYLDRRSAMYQVPANVRSLVQALATPMEKDEYNQMRGLGLTYGQVVGVLSRMCRQGDIQAKFVLQDPPDIQNIVDNASAAERPDMPE